jgi:hypothetical protein
VLPFGRLSERIVRVATPPIPLHWKFHDIKEILSEPPKPPPWLIRGLVAQASATSISALPHGMKSFTWLQAAIDAALGRPVWDHFDVTGVKRTLFIETEDAEWMLWQRVHALANGIGVTPADITDAGCFYLGCTGPFDLVKMADKLRNVIRKYKPDFTVLSTLQGLLGERNWNEQGDMGPVNSLLIDIAHNYSPLVSITHSPLNIKLRRPAGSVTQGANFPFQCHFIKRFDNGQTIVDVKVDSKMGNEEDASKFQLRLCQCHPDAIRFVYESAAAETTKKDIIMAALQGMPNASTNDIAQQFDVGERYVRKLKEEIHNGSNRK